MFSGVEDSSRIIVIIEWSSVEAHSQHRGTPAHNHMRAIASKYQTAKSDGAHFELHDIKNGRGL